MAFPSVQVGVLLALISNCPHFESVPSRWLRVKREAFVPVANKKSNAGWASSLSWVKYGPNPALAPFRKGDGGHRGHQGQPRVGLAPTH